MKHSTKKRIAVLKKLSPFAFRLSPTSGFTLVETLVALAIFFIAISGVITVAFSGGVNANIVKNKTIASYLAQEGIEIIRAKRDHMVLADPQNGWENFAIDMYGNGSTNCSASGGGCEFDVTDPTFSHIDEMCVNNCAFLQYSPSGFYNYGSGATTIFKRTIGVYMLPNGNASTDQDMHVVSTVTWLEGQTTKTFTISEDLFNWYSQTSQYQ